MDTRVDPVGFSDWPVTGDPHSNPQSLEFSFRSKRFVLVQQLIEKIIREKGHCEILDLGGTEVYWRVGADFLNRNRSRIRITLSNLEGAAAHDREIFSVVQGDASDLNLLSGRTFDLLHSNSVIEHVGDLADMARFAANVRRLAPRYYVQTPNYWFPYEPHFRFPGFQYLPVSVRVALVRNFALGFHPKTPDLAEAKLLIRHHHVISATQMRAFFPDANVSFEKVFGLNKSIIAVRD